MIFLICFLISFSKNHSYYIKQIRDNQDFVRITSIFCALFTKKDGAITSSLIFYCVIICPIKRSNAFYDWAV